MIVQKNQYIYIRILRELNVPLTIKELVKSGVVIEHLDENEPEDNIEMYFLSFCNLYYNKD